MSVPSSAAPRPRRDDRRFELRRLTAEAHVALETVVGNLTSLRAYKHYAQGLYSGRAPIEAALQVLDWPPVFGDWRPVMIADALKTDLVDLGLDAALGPPATDIPQDMSGLLGLLYVLEGSSLGARLVYRRALTLGLDDRFGARHLAVQAGSGGHWQAFLTVLDAAVPYDGARAAATAAATFGAMYQAMRIGPSARV